MPYFRNNNIHLLLIHIPKTGGSSLEEYFSKKYNIPLNRKSLAFCHDKTISSVSMQHYPFSLISTRKQKLGVTNDDSLTILSSVRNPYTRIISDLLYFNWIMEHTDKNTVELKIKEYFKRYNTNNEATDNHIKPQYLFLMEGDSINSKIQIMKQESLTSDMHALGFTDFNIFKNVHGRDINYYNYLNFTSILLINNFYAKDFELFDYKMIQTQEELLALQTNVKLPSPPPSRNVKSSTFKRMFKK